jgi:cytochrome d ubiquinol oxidase subunit I
VAAILGWLTREGGRQPWAAYGLLKVDDAVSPISGGVMLASFLGFTALLLTLAVTNWVLIAKRAARGTADPALGRSLSDVSPDEHRPEPVLAR